MNAFLDAYRVLTRVYAEGAHLKIALSSLPAGGHGRTVKLCYCVLENNAYLDLCVRTLSAKPPKPAVRLVLKIALAGMLFADMPRPVAVSEAVSLVREIGKGGMAGFVNAALRNFAEENVRLPEGRDRLAVLSNFPRFALDEICDRYGPRAEAILLAKSRGVSVRFVRGMENYLSLPHEDTPFDTVKLFRNFTRDEGFSRGDYTFQSVGSVAVCSVVEGCDALLDACAAPGGKSVLLSERCRKIVSCDVHAHRVGLIESYAARMGAQNVTALQRDSAAFDPAFSEAFDGVLVDAPCSGLGTVAENPDLPLRKNEGGMSELVALQTAILDNCARYVKRGGRLYYATCSLLERENDGVVRKFSETHPAFEIERADCPLPHEKTQFGLQFLPDTAYGAGFYVCKMRRA